MKLSSEISLMKNGPDDLTEASSVTHTGANRGKGAFTAASVVAKQMMPTTKRRRRMNATVQVSARFLPYGDVCGATVDGATAVEDVTAERGLGRRVSCFEVNEDMAGRHLQQASVENEILPSTQWDVEISSIFMKELHSTLSYTFAGDYVASSARNHQEMETAESKRWFDMFRAWPLELATSGYAEWWLRHPRCCADATSYFAHIIEGIMREERHRKLCESDFFREELNSEFLQGALSMLQAVYADPPRSLKAMFLTSLHHQRLFFLSCRLGAHKYPFCNGKKKNTRVLALCLSLASAISQRIAGTQLTMRHDLIRFLGNVQSAWQSLLELRPDEATLRLEFDRVKSLLAFALD
ncbi:hypothetical protein TCDM_13400 [Trypanosoma cruzi Dm28c]|uniref:Uncharacterized protein n=1 Tax=Trypanosoma cruzi Dm28c TaxID=1416333 RepID=V5CIG6_TRYCR|nr:hypothetical protein TCDM_13400 [Trypanosoma cruzi Dm28c]PBJ73705.1 hypothetical protein BCY84_13682 [Trypanosoma cruzi cruzi]PBJ79110.1 hypothetical protein BCY84_03360 [Trypanosoma cruzi cruzi]